MPGEFYRTVVDLLAEIPDVLNEGLAALLLRTHSGDLGDEVADLFALTFSKGQITESFWPCRFSSDGHIYAFRGVFLGCGRSTWFFRPEYNRFQSCMGQRKWPKLQVETTIGAS